MRRRVGTLLVVGLIGVAAGCGGESGPDDEPTPGPIPEVTAPPSTDGETALADGAASGSSSVTVDIPGVDGPLHLRADCAGLSYLDVSVSGGGAGISDAWVCARTADSVDHLVLDVTDGSTADGPVDVTITVTPFGRRLSDEEAADELGSDEESSGFAPAPDDASYAFVVTAG